MNFSKKCRLLVQRKATENSLLITFSSPTRCASITMGNWAWMSGAAAAPNKRGLDGNDLNKRVTNNKMVAALAFYP